MRTTAAAVAVLALALTACSSTDKPEQPATSTSSAAPSPTVDLAAARKACVAAWLELLEAGTAEAENEPAVCKQVPGQSAEMFTEATLERNKANRERYDACLENPGGPDCEEWMTP